MTYAQLRRECVKRNLLLDNCQDGLLLADLENNTVVISPEYCTLEAVEAYLDDVEPLEMTDEEADKALERIEERLQEQTEIIRQEAGGND